MARTLKKEKGIHKARYEKHKAELYIVYLAKATSPTHMIKRIKEMGFVAVEGAGKGSYLPPVVYKPTMDARWISKNGEAVKLKEHLAPGKVTIFDFSAKWCGPCKDVDHAIFALMKKYPKLALRKINVVDWNRPVARQYMTGVAQLPYLIIYNAKGAKAKVIVGRKLKLLQQTVQKLLQPSK